MKAQRGIAFRPHISGTQKGFSLIEVMISMVILMVGLISLLVFSGSRWPRRKPRSSMEPPSNWPTNR